MSDNDATDSYIIDQLIALIPAHLIAKKLHAHKVNEFFDGMDTHHDACVRTYGQVLKLPPMVVETNEEDWTGWTDTVHISGDIATIDFLPMKGIVKNVDAVMKDFIFFDTAFLYMDKLAFDRIAMMGERYKSLEVDVPYVNKKLATI